MLVVIAEDEVEFRELMSDLFRQAGCEVHAFGNGQEAYGFLKSRRPPPDTLLFTDLFMPLMSGEELLERLANESIGIRTVVLSAYLGSELAARIERFRPLAILYKPVDMEVLLAFVGTAPAGVPAAQPPEPAMVPKAAGSAPAEKPAGTPEPPEGVAAKSAADAPPAPPADVVARAQQLGAVADGKCRVLVADDDAEFASMIREVLEDAGYAVTLARDGGEATRLAMSERFCVVFMDIVMPGVGGVEAISRIHGFEPGLLTVAITGAADESEIARAMQAGAFRVLRKPLDTEQLRDLLAQWALIGKRREWVTDRYAVIRPPRWGFFSFLQDRRNRRIVVLIALLLVLLGLAVPPIHRAVTALTAPLGDGIIYVRDALRSVIRAEGYLQRDEQRELERERNRDR